MEKNIIKYICGNINTLSNIPIRLYEHGKHEKTYSVIELLKDPANLHQKELHSTQKSLEYIFVGSTEYYGIIKHNEFTIVAGPVGHFLDDISAMKETAFLLGLSSAEEINSFISSLKLANQMPLERFLQMLCFVHFCLSGELLTVKDLAIADEFQKTIAENIIFEQTQQSISENSEEKAVKHNFFAFEKMMLYYIEKGKFEELIEFFKETTPGTVGKIAPNNMRNLKNTFIATATLVSRAAIKGGLDQDEAFTMSDIYIQRCEVLNSPSEIMNLQYHMVVDYTNKIRSLKENKNLGPLVNQAVNYIKKNFNTIQNSDEIASAVSSSRSYLSYLFKKETGLTMSEMILREKIEYAKRLMLYTDRPLIAISNYLGFSSQSHFQNTFKKFEKITPKEFKNQNN